MMGVAGDSAVGAEILAGVVASQAQVIQGQQLTIAEQARTIDAISGGRRITLTLDQTIGELWANYFRTLPDKPWKKVAESTMKRFLAMHGNVRVGDFGPLQWEHYRSDPEIKDHYHPTTITIQLIRIKAMLSWAVKMGQLHENPLRGVKREGKKRKRQTEVSLEDEETIMKDLPPIMRAVFVVAVDSGMRRNEIRTLEWKQIDLTTGTVELRAEQTKTQTARTAYLTPRAIDALKELSRYPGCPYVFVNPKRKRPYSGNYIWYCFRKAADENGIEAAPGDRAVRFHDLRRSCCVRLIRLGARLDAVQEILGHAEVSTTASYLFLRRREVAEAHALLDKAVRRGPKRADGSRPARASAKAKKRTAS